MRRHQGAKVEHFDVSNMIYHNFSRAAVSYTLNRENVNVMLELTVKDPGYCLSLDLVSFHAHRTVMDSVTHTESETALICKRDKLRIVDIIIGYEQQRNENSRQTHRPFKSIGSSKVTNCL